MAQEDCLKLKNFEVTNPNSSLGLAIIIMGHSSKIEHRSSNHGGLAEVMELAVVMGCIILHLQCEAG